MSLERAYVNCKRCNQISILTCNNLYGDRDIARNEAMKALEDVNNDFSKELLKVCKGCDYSKPKICELINTKEK